MLFRSVDLKRFMPNLSVRQTFRNELNINESTIVFLFLGRIKKDKGILDLVHAFKKLSNDRKDVFFLLVGYDEGNLLPEIHSILNDNDNYFYYGPTSTPENLFPVADIFCLPSYREGFGTSIIEASSCKLPIICSDIYGLSEAIIDEKTGLRHKVKDVGNLYIQMLKLANDKELRERLGNNGREYVRDYFSSDMISAEWLNFYRNILNENNLI